MASPASMIAFEKAKADFEKKAREVSASAGIINDGIILEEELVRRSIIEISWQLTQTYSVFHLLVQSSVVGKAGLVAIQV